MQKYEKMAMKLLVFGLDVEYFSLGTIFAVFLCFQTNQ